MLAAMSGGAVVTAAKLKKRLERFPLSSAYSSAKLSPAQFFPPTWREQVKLLTFLANSRVALGNIWILFPTAKPFMIRTLSKPEAGEWFLKPDKGHLQKYLHRPSSLKGERLNAFSLRPATKPGGYALSPLMFNIVLEVPATPVRKEKERNGLQIGKEEMKLFWFSDDGIIFIEKPTKSILKNS